MGLRFTGLSPLTESCLDYVLRGLPPPLPVPAEPLSSSTLNEDVASLRLDDGSVLSWVAEAPLLSAARQSRRVVRAPRVLAPLELTSITSFLREATEPHCANDTPKVEQHIDRGSPITAIFQSADLQSPRSADCEQLAAS